MCFLLSCCQSTNLSASELQDVAAERCHRVHADPIEAVSLKLAGRLSAKYERILQVELGMRSLSFDTCLKLLCFCFAERNSLHV